MVGPDIRSCLMAAGGNAAPKHFRSAKATFLKRNKYASKDVDNYPRTHASLHSRSFLVLKDHTVES